MADTAEFYTDFVPTFYDWVKGKKRHILHVSTVDFPTCWLDRNPGCLITALYIFDTATYADIRYGENGSKSIRFRWSEQEIPLERLLSIIQSPPNEAVVQYDEVIPADPRITINSSLRIYLGPTKRQDKFLKVQICLLNNRQPKRSICPLHLRPPQQILGLRRVVRRPERLNGLEIREMKTRKITLPRAKLSGTVVSGLTKTPKTRIVVLKRPGKPSVTRESVLPNNDQNSTNKSNTSKINILEGKSSPTSDRVSTIIEKGYNVSLSGPHRDLSDKLWLPIATDYVNTELSSSRGITADSSFCVTKQVPTGQSRKNRSYQTSVTTLSTSTVKENLTKKGNLRRTNVLGFKKGQKPKDPNKVMRVKKYQVHLEPQFAQQIRDACHAVRYIYNQCVRLCCVEGEPANVKHLRSLLINDSETNILPNQILQDHLKIPYDVKDNAIMDFLEAFNTQKILVSTGEKSHFEMHYRKRRSHQPQTLKLPKGRARRISDWEIGWYPKVWKKQTFKCREGFGEVDHAVRLSWTKNDKFYLIFPTDVDKIQNRSDRIVALDPGVKIFQTTYDIDGTSYRFGEDEIYKLDVTARIADRMRKGIGRIWKDKEKSGRKFRERTNKTARRRLSKKANKLEEYIKNRLSDFHRKSVKFLCSQYGTVIIPEFRSKDMAKKRNTNGKWRRGISKDTTRCMIRWGHFKFRELLKAKGEQMGTKIIVGTEEYTSKTCTNCMYVKDYLAKTERQYDCTNCGVSIHRDINAARNILMLNWNKTGSTLGKRVLKLRRAQTRLGLPTSLTDRK